MSYEQFFQELFFFFNEFVIILFPLYITVSSHFPLQGLGYD